MHPRLYIGESKQSASTALLFCTTGVLLRMLEDDPELHGCAHVHATCAHALHVRMLEDDPERHGCAHVLIDEGLES